MIHNITIKDVTSIIDPDWNSDEYYISNGEPSSEIYPGKVKTNFYLLFHIIEGWMDVKINDNYTVRVEPDMTMAISPEMIYQDIACSPSYTAHVICFTKKFILKNIASLYTLDMFNFFSFNADPIIKTCNSDRANLSQLYSIIVKKRYEIDSESHMDLLRALFFSYLYETLIIYDKGNYKNRNGLSKLSVREMDIYMKFKNLISQKIHYHRDLEFYASELCVTPKHLIKLIKNITGQTPKKLIDSSLLSILKYKLEYTALPVSLLAEELNFSSTPAFCRFFKMQTGMTPQQYRNSH